MRLIAILATALILRLINLNQSLWLDEAVQAITSQGSFSAIFSELRGDFHPPLYHFFMWLWVHLFGSSEIVLRLPSVLFGVGTVWVIYKLGSLGKLGNLGIVAALFLATAPFHIYYSQEARMYAMTAFFASLSMYYFLRVIGEKRENRGAVWGYLAGTAAMLYSDYYGFLVLLAQIIGGWIILRRKIAPLLNCFIAPLLLFLPWLPFFLIQLKTGLQATQDLPNWAGLANVSFLKALPLTFIKFSLGRITIFNRALYALVSLGIVGALGLMGGRGAFNWYKQKDRKDHYLVIVLWLIVPIFTAWLTSVFIPNYQPFRLLLVLPAFYLLLAYGIIKEYRLQRILLCMFVLGVNLASSFVYFVNPYFHREDWRGVANYLRRENLSIVISSKTFDWPLVFYGAESQIVSVSDGVRPVKDKDRLSLISQIRKTGKREIAYTPYLADVYDWQDSALAWLEESGFVKIKEINFNQIPVWVYSSSITK